ncbi:MAG: Hsp20/alpha crystallin family protein [Planctomycetota bacterium]|nr:Hsp20/alpha crystallin family protein [Planctomycetota bacterium]MDA1248141.1 Hsp20/alpha crystallin family protein [Planctomycetota bacterium]
MSNDLSRLPPEPADPSSNETSSGASGAVSDEGRHEPANPRRYVFTPQIDIFETADGLVLRADLPGVSLETLDLEVQNNRLTLFGRVPDATGPDARLTHQEYREGDFLRSFILSENVDHERISAKLANGVLEVFLPHAPKTEARKIEVTGS